MATIHLILAPVRTEDQPSSVAMDYPPAVVVVCDGAVVVVVLELGWASCHSLCRYFAYRRAAGIVGSLIEDASASLSSGRSCEVK
jgi:hypothetical protein